MTFGTPVKARWLGGLMGMLAVLAGNARADIEPLKLSFAPEDQSVYAPPVPAREDQGVNQGGMNLDLTFAFMSDYVYRGINHSDFPNQSKSNPKHFIEVKQRGEPFPRNP